MLLGVAAAAALPFFSSADTPTPDSDYLALAAFFISCMAVACCLFGAGLMILMNVTRPAAREPQVWAPLRRRDDELAVALRRLRTARRIRRGEPLNV